MLECLTRVLAFEFELLLLDARVIEQLLDMAQASAVDAIRELVAHCLDLTLCPAFVLCQVDQAVGQGLAQAHELVEQAMALLDDAACLGAGLVDTGLGLGSGCEGLRRGLCAWAR